MLPTYSPSLRVSPNDAKQDQIRLEVGDWHLTVTQLHEFFGALCVPGEGGSLSFTDASFRRRSVQIRMGGRGTGERVGGPLFTGELKARLLRPEDASLPDSFVLRLSLSLNPTRYVAHQPSRQFAGLHPSEWELSTPSLYRRRVPRATRLETVLDANDNVLLSRASQAHGRSEAWPLHLGRYWGGLLDELDDTFCRGASESGAAVQRVAEWLNLRLVETYWEFAADDPTALVSEIEAPLFQLGYSAEARAFGYEHGETVAALEHNARSLSVRLRPGVHLRVYAKTTGRMRFEIIHELRKIAPARRIRHTASVDGALFEWLNQLAVDAARELNVVFEHLERAAIFPPNSLRPYNLVRRICEAIPDGELSDAVLSLIVNNRALRLAPSDPLRPAVEALRRSEVLIAQGRSNFVVAPLFRRAVAELRGELGRPSRRRFRTRRADH